MESDEKKPEEVVVEFPQPKKAPGDFPQMDVGDED
jgi:hypothetical protein